MSEFDIAFTRAINGLAGRNEVIDLVMIWLSLAGVPILVAGVAIQWWRKQDRPHVRHVLIAAGLSFLLGLAINQVILLFVHRIRPYDAGVTHLLIARSADPSFPSDHATATIAIAAAFLLHGMRKSGVLFLTAALAVMLSRVFIGIHYASDVLGGALTGLAAAAGVRALFREGTRLDRCLTSIF